MSALRSLALALVLLTVSLLTPGPFGAARADTERITIGAILILSGMGAEQGINSQRGALLAQDDVNAAGGINGKELEIIFEDEVGPSAPGAVTAYRKLTTIDGVKFILGPQWQNEVLAVDPMAVKDDVFLVVPSTCGSRMSDHTFCLWAEPERQMRIYAKYIFERHKSVVAFGSSESWETETLQAFVKAYTALGGKVVKEITPNQDSPQVKAEAAITKRADAEAVFSTAAIHFVSYRQELVRLQFKKPYYTVELFQELINAAGPAAEGVISISPVLPSGPFVEKFQKRFQSLPDTPAVQAYDGVQMLAAAIRTRGETFEGVQSYFRDFGTFEGVQGTIRSEAGKAIVPLGIHQVRGGKQVLLETR